MYRGDLEKLVSLPIADSLGVNVNESERERSGIICRQFCGVRRVGAIFRGALEVNNWAAANVDFEAERKAMLTNVVNRIQSIVNIRDSGQSMRSTTASLR